MPGITATSAALVTSCFIHLPYNDTKLAYGLSEDTDFLVHEVHEILFETDFRTHKVKDIKLEDFWTHEDANEVDSMNY